MMTYKILKNLNSVCTHNWDLFVSDPELAMLKIPLPV